MSRKLLIDAGLIGVFAIGAVAYLSMKEKKADKVAEQAQVEAVVEAKAKPKPKPKSASAYMIRKNPQDGQYWTDGKVNHGRVHFLVDTGASTVALTYQDAQKAGIRVRDLNYNVPVSTAGGTNYAAYVELDSVTIGGIMLRDVDALVIREGLHVSLLGMTFLGQLQKVEATPDALLLRL